MLDKQAAVIYRRVTRSANGFAIMNKQHLSSFVAGQGTVKPLLTDTSIIRTPLYYGQFVLSQKCQKSYIPYLYNTATSVKRTLSSVPLVSVLKRFDCTLVPCVFRQTFKQALVAFLFVFVFFLSLKLHF